MTFNEHEYDLETVAEELREEMEAAADRQAEAKQGTEAASVAASDGQTAARFLSGIQWAIDKWGATSVTVGSLTNGERHRVDDVSSSTPFKRSDCYVAAGLVDAPFLKHDPDAITEGEFKDTVIELTDFHPAFVDWLERKVTEASRVGDMGKSYQTLVREKRESTK